MKKWYLQISLGIILAVLAAAIAPAAASPELPADTRVKFDPDFLQAILDAPASEPLRFLVSFQTPGPHDGRRQAVVTRLQTAAQVSQERIWPLLNRLQDDQHIRRVRPFWIFNGLAAEGDRSAIMALAAQKEVISLRPDRWQQWIIPDQESTVYASRPSELDWGISQIQADQVWSALEVDGRGVVVANIDSGVDWNHPVLQSNYRGWHGGNPIHTGNWFDATGTGALYPVDGLGHGTHVMGLLAGQEGVGAAPGASWIAVQAFNSSGYALDSWLHAAFEWILAPAGDPNLAPDIVNNSWSNRYGGSQEFIPDVQALRAAGILPIFSAGNNGPAANSVGAPASYLESVAVAASDPDDEIAAFSGRGPSPFAEIKPEIAAPGVNLLSSLPGGAYGAKSGTSMSAPLVGGVAALLMEADPSLTAEQVTYVITSTAVPLGDEWPNTDAGWGRVDALAAVAAVLQPGLLQGQVRGFGAGPLANATVQATEHGGGATAVTKTSQDGRWTLALSPGFYDLKASAFGYAPALVSAVEAITATTTQQDFTLSPLPGGVVIGQVTAVPAGAPLRAVLRATSTPVSTTAAADGTYALWLPAGSYTLTAEYWGYRVGRAELSVSIGGTSPQDFALVDSPRLLLVDSGAWHYGSQISYFRSALDDLGYLYHDWRIKDPLLETPAITDLLPYDGLIWSSPSDSPGYIGAGTVISDYLSLGGNLLLSGQDVGFWDGGRIGFAESAYFRHMLKANFVKDDAESTVLTGAISGPLAGMALTLNGPDSADNQSRPDRAAVNNPDHAAPLLDYDNYGHGGIATSQCLPYRSFYLAFGLEGVNSRAKRAQVMDRALDWFASPRPAVGVELIRKQALLTAPAGNTVTHTVRLRNTGEAGAGDSYTLTVSGADWPTSLITPSRTLSPCHTAQVRVRVQIPAGVDIDQVDHITLTAQSVISPSQVAAVSLSTKTPAAVLLVDDDLWYDQESKYQEALDANGIQYDYWDVRLDGWGRPGPPPTTTLNHYPMVLWFTGYDWFRPLSDDETARLEAYLAAGGRLFLSSQDALYYQADSLLRQHYLGVLDYTEDVTPTLAYGADGRLGLRKPHPLDYPFNNFSDGVIPAEETSVELYSQSGWPMGLTQMDQSWKSIFFAFPFETLPADSRPAVMERIVGWLGWLGGSEFAASARAISAGEIVTFTAVLRHDGDQKTIAHFDARLPANFDLITTSVQGGAYDGQGITWEAELAPGTEHLVRYAGTVSQSITSTAVISYAYHQLAHHPSVQVWTDAPDLGASSLSADPAIVAPGQAVTYTLSLRNQGPADAPAATARWVLPSRLTVLSDTVNSSSGNLVWTGNHIDWSGPITAGQSITVTFTGLTFPSAETSWLPSTAVLNDGVADPLLIGHILTLQPKQLFLPIIMR